MSIHVQNTIINSNDHHNPGLECLLCVLPNGATVLRQLGITEAKRKIAKETGIPTSKAGIERKIGQTILKVGSNNTHIRKDND